MTMLRLNHAAARAVLIILITGILLGGSPTVSWGQESVADLVKLLDNTNPPVRVAALQLMSDLGRTAGDRFRDREAEILKALREAGPIIARLSEDAEAGVRRAAAEALGSTRADVRDARVRAAWGRAVADANGEVRLAAAKAVAEHVDRGLERIRATLMPEPRLALTSDFFADANQMLAILSAAYGQPDAPLKAAALDSFQHLLTSIPSIPGLPADARMSAGYPALTANLKELAGRVGKAIGDVDAALQGTDGRVRVAAAGVIEQMVGSRLRDWLLQPALQPDGRAALDSIVAGVNQAIPSLERSVGEPDADVRRACLYTLEALGPAAASSRPILLAALRDPDTFVRWAAARALGRVGPDGNARLTEQLALGLGELMEDPDIDVRLAAAQSLEYFGPAAIPAVPALARVFVPRDRLNTNLPGFEWPPAFAHQPPQIPDRTQELAVARTLQAIAAQTKEDFPAEALPHLLQGLVSEEDRVRRILPTLLHRFGAASKKAIPALELMLKVDDDLEARENAARAIIRILAK